MIKVDNICMHTFVSNLITDDSIVFDCGANQGEFSLAIHKKYNSKIYGFEPDPRLFPKLPKIEGCTFFQFAIAAKNGELKFNLGENQCSSLIYNEDNNSQSNCLVKCITIEKFCKENSIQKIDLLKLDIEGAELDVLKNLSPEFLQKKIVQITVEFHEFLDKTDIPKIRQIIGRLQENGYYYISFAMTYGDILFLNKNFFASSLLEKARLNYHKCSSGIKRIIKRNFI